MWKPCYIYIQLCKLLLVDKSMNKKTASALCYSGQV